MSEQQNQPPDFNTDPAGHLVSRVAQLEQAYVGAIQDSQRTLAEKIANDEKSIRQDRPDYDEALKFAIKKEEDQLRLQGADENTAKRLAAQALTRKAVTRGGNVAESVISLAEQDGYTPKIERPATEFDHVFKEVFDR